jgi:hypothetical protein
MPWPASEGFEKRRTLERLTKKRKYTKNTKTFTTAGLTAEAHIINEHQPDSLDSLDNCTATRFTGGMYLHRSDISRLALRLSTPADELGEL